MKYLLAVCIVAAVFVPKGARCQEHASILLEHDGVQGYWFSMEAGDRLLKDVTELNLLRGVVTLTNVKLEATDSLIDLLKQDVSASEAISIRWRAAFEDQVDVTHAQQDYYVSEIESLKKWYRSPVLWFCVGVVVTGALAVGLNYGLAETRD